MLHSGLPTNLVSWRMPENENHFQGVTSVEKFRLSITGRTKFINCLRDNNNSGCTWENQHSSLVNCSRSMLKKCASSLAFCRQCWCFAKDLDMKQTLLPTWSLSKRVGRRFWPGDNPVSTFGGPNRRFYRVSPIRPDVDLLLTSWFVKRATSQSEFLFISCFSNFSKTKDWQV